MRASVEILVSIALLLLTANLCLAQAPLGEGPNFLACANYNDRSDSSDMTLIVQLEIDGKVILDEAYPVTYTHLGSNDRTLGEFLEFDWVQPSYDDAGWSQGFSGVGFADGDDNTEVPPGRIAIYTRYRFELVHVATIKSVVLRVDYDDAYAIWLNGVEVARSVALDGKELSWNITAAGIANHGATEQPKGRPNDHRQYQEERQISTVPVKSVGVESTGRLAMIWGQVKASN